MRLDLSILISHVLQIARGKEMARPEEQHVRVGGLGGTADVGLVL